jgi:hypothetical protein
MRTSLLLIMVALTYGCEQEGKEVVAPKCEVWLDGSVEKLSGIDWPKDEGGLIDFTGEQDPLDITIHFPSGRRFSHYSRVTFLDQVDGIVCRVVVTPIKLPADFRSAVDALKEIGKALGISKNEQFATKIDSWLNELPPSDSFESRSLGCEVEKGVDLFAEIRTIGIEKGWLLSLEFYALRHYPD